MRSSRFKSLISCAFICVKWSCIKNRFLISSFDRFFMTLILTSVLRNFAMTGRGPLVSPPGTLWMSNISAASRSTLTVSFRILHRSERRFSFGHFNIFFLSNFTLRSERMSCVSGRNELQFSEIPNYQIVRTDYLSERTDCTLR